MNSMTYVAASGQTFLMAGGAVLCLAAVVASIMARRSDTDE
ncbi:hypothetical protein [Pseudarthrobacter humi]|nr:hypothetical protein [Pseudarthrobacter humi]